MTYPQSVKIRNIYLVKHTILYSVGHHIHSGNVLSYGKCCQSDFRENIAYHPSEHFGWKKNWQKGAQAQSRRGLGVWHHLKSLGPPGPPTKIFSCDLWFWTIHSTWRNLIYLYVENLDRAGMVQTNLCQEPHFVAWLVLSKAQTPPPQMAINFTENKEGIHRRFWAEWFLFMITFKSVLLGSIGWIERFQDGRSVNTTKEVMYSYYKAMKSKDIGRGW